MRQGGKAGTNKGAEGSTHSDHSSSDDLCVKPFLLDEERRDGVTPPRLEL